MRRLFLPASLVLILSAGCAMPQGMNDSCNWPAEPEGRRDLIADVRIAEELAMRYADAGAESKAAHGRRRSECEAKLFDAVAQIHGVSLAAIAQAREELDGIRWDTPIHVPLLAFYIAVTTFLTGRVQHRFPRDEKVAAVVATLFASVGVGIAIIVLGHLWGGVVEMMRVGNMHMSYRVERLGWREYSEEVFGFAVVAFWCATLIRYRLPSRGNRSAATF